MNDKEPVKYKNAFERNEEVRKERLNRAWGIDQHPAEKYYEDRMNEIDKKGKSYLVKHLNKTNPVLENRGKQTLAINHTANKVLNNQVKNGNIKKEDLMLQPDRNGLLTNKAKTIAMRDSFMAKQFNNALGVKDYPEATPEQVGALAERLERSRQMTGGKATNLKDLENRYKQPDKPFIKKKKSSISWNENLGKEKDFKTNRASKDRPGYLYALCSNGNSEERSRISPCGKKL